MTLYPPKIYQYLEAGKQGKPVWELYPDSKSLREICLSEGLIILEHGTIEIDVPDGAGRSHVESVVDTEPDLVLTGKGELALLTKRTGPTQKPATVNKRMAELLLDDPSVIEMTAEEWAQKFNCSAAAIKQTPTWEKIMKLRESNKNERAARDGDKHIR